MAELFDAQIVRQWAQAGAQALREHRAELNALNVFPVPDGDTGTNLYLTFLAAAEAEAARSGDVDDVADALAAMARGALLGARGNSGVMLAQALQAFAAVAKAEPRISLARFLQAGAAAARTAVAEPKEGTALTVLDAAAEVFAREPDAAAVAARTALARTPTMLESLARAGVVDAGGRGVVVLLDALSAVWHGAKFDSPPVGYVPSSATPASCEPDAAFELMFLLDGVVATGMRDQLQQLGKSLAVTSDGMESQVHIHVDEVDAALALVPAARSIRIEKLSAPTSRRIIAQAAGIATMQMLAELGVLVVPGEPGDRASVRDFVTAGIRSAASELLLLPGDDDSHKVAELAAHELRESGFDVELIATRSVLQSIAAVAVFEADRPLVQLAERMRAAAAGVRSISVSIAQRVSDTPIGRVEPGDVIAFREAEIATRSADLVDAVCAALLQEPDCELVTLLAGADLADDDMQDVVEAVGQLLPNAEVQRAAGGQRGNILLIGLE